jgi:predicted nuclease of restriction endonuclease-like (RecB) superfamily
MELKQKAMDRFFVMVEKKNNPTSERLLQINSEFCKRLWTSHNKNELIQKKMNSEIYSISQRLEQLTKEFTIATPLLNQLEFEYQDNMDIRNCNRNLRILFIYLCIFSQCQLQNQVVNYLVHKVVDYGQIK